MLVPEDRQRDGGLEPLLPQGAPAVRPDDLRVRRCAHDDLPLHCPGELVGDQAAAPVMNVVGVALLGPAGGDDGLQRLGCLGGGLQRGEGAVGNPAHSDLSVAPGLLRDPVEHHQCIGLFHRGIFIDHASVGIARAANTDPHQCDSSLCEERAGHIVAISVTVALAVREIFQHGPRRLHVGGGWEE